MEAQLTDGWQRTEEYTIVIGGGVTGKLAGGPFAGQCTSVRRPPRIRDQNTLRDEKRFHTLLEGALLGATYNAEIAVLTPRWHPKAEALFNGGLT